MGNWSYFTPSNWSYISPYLQPVFWAHLGIFRLVGTVVSPRNPSIFGIQRGPASLQVGGDTPLKNPMFSLDDDPGSTPLASQIHTGWWLNQPIWKICSSNWIISPNRDENKKSLKPSPSLEFVNLVIKVARWSTNQPTFKFNSVTFANSAEAIEGFTNQPAWRRDGNRGFIPKPMDDGGKLPPEWWKSFDPLGGSAPDL